MIVLLGGPKDLDGRVMDVFSNARAFHNAGGFKGNFYWCEEGNEHTYYFSFTEGGRDYYLHESEVKLNGRDFDPRV